MKVIIVLVVSSLYIHTIYYTYNFTRGELRFRKAEAYARVCEQLKDTKICMKSAALLQEAIKYNPKEYYYRYKIQSVLMTIFRKTKDTRVANIALKHIDEAQKFSWDRQYPHIARANILGLFGRKEEALKELYKAKKYIPHNKKLLSGIKRMEGK